MERRIEERRGEAGFSVLEGLIAAVLLLIITVGVLPLFSRSMLNNAKGNDSTRQSNGAVDEFERTSSLPFNSGAMNVVAGTTLVERTTIALKRLPAGQGPSESVSSQWEPLATLPSTDDPVTIRERTLRQFSLSDFNASDPAASFTNPLSSGTEDRLIHVKTIDVDIYDAERDPQAVRPYRLRFYQAF